MEKKIIKTAKELFDAEVRVSGVKYIDEVADIHYYYVENEDNAHLYMADEVNKSYDLAIFEKAHVFIKAHIFEYMEAMKGMLENDKAQTLFNNLTCGAEHEFQALYNFCYYCDFLMQNTKLAIDGRSFKDEYEEVEEDDCVDDENLTAEYRCGRTSGLYQVYVNICMILKNEITTEFHHGKNIDMRIENEKWGKEYFNDLSLSNDNLFRLVEDDFGEVFLQNGKEYYHDNGEKYVEWYDKDALHLLDAEELFYIIRSMH